MNRDSGLNREQMLEFIGNDEYERIPRDPEIKGGGLRLNTNAIARNIFRAQLRNKLDELVEKGIVKRKGGV